MVNLGPWELAVVGTALALLTAAVAGARGRSRRTFFVAGLLLPGAGVLLLLFLPRRR